MTTRARVAFASDCVDAPTSVTCRYIRHKVTHTRQDWINIGDEEISGDTKRDTNQDPSNERDRDHAKNL